MIQPPWDELADTISKFCTKVSISRRHFYELLRRRKSPATVTLGRRHQVRRGEDEARSRERGEAA
jgi:hypothetical protein